MTQTQPKFLTIYNTLYKEIQIGKYPDMAMHISTEKDTCITYIIYN